MKPILLFFLALFAFSGLSAQSDLDSLFHVEINGNDTDPFIVFGLGKHQVFYNPTSATQNTLLLHLVGSYDKPDSNLIFPSLAANNGFHSIVLSYRNGIAAKSACKDIPDTNCYLNFRKEIIEGIDYSTEVSVNPANSINNRLLKLLQYLTQNYPGQNWDQYYSGSTIAWNKIIVSGHSQGGGHAAIIGITQPVKRVLMFASPNDFSDTLNMLAPWTTLPHLAADSNYYSFNARFDDVVDFSIQYAHSQALGQAAFGDTVLVDALTAPFNHTRQLYTNQEVAPGNPLHFTHDIAIRDAETPIDSLGKPEFACVWLYMLGIDCPIALARDPNFAFPNIQVFPNPFQNELTLTALPKQINCEIVLFDILGTEILLKNSAYKTEITLSLKHLKSGINFIRLMQDDGHILFSSKVLKL